MLYLNHLFESELMLHLALIEEILEAKTQKEVQVQVEEQINIEHLLDPVEKFKPSKKKWTKISSKKNGQTWSNFLVQKKGIKKLSLRPQEWKKKMRQDWKSSTAHIFR